MKPDWKPILRLYLITWGILLVLSLVIGESSLSSWQQVLVTALLALAVPALYLVARWGEGKATFTLYRPGSPEGVYRVEGEWVYKGAEEKATYYLKKGKLYGFESMKPLCCVKDGRIVRTGESEPFLRREGDKILSCETGETVYEIK